MSLTPNGYKSRLIDAEVTKNLRAFGAVSIEGPKWVGKTWTARNACNSEFSMVGSTGPLMNRDIASDNIQRALVGESPHLIDEWQELPRIWDVIRANIDTDAKKGKFVLTGSSVPKRDDYYHSGAGRIKSIDMRTMSLYESGDSHGTVSLEDILNGKLEMMECGDVTLEYLVDLAIRGGWPGSLRLNPEDFNLIPEQYVRLAVDDACRLDGKRRNHEKMRILLKSLARNESTLVSDATIMKDMRAYDDESIATDTYADFMDCLDRIHLIESTPNFKPNVRSDMRIGKRPKRHLTDVSLAIAALGLNKESLMNDLNTFGFMFEALCEHDLDLYARANGGRLFHYRDGRDREIDAVIEMPGGDWCAIEIKLGTGQIDTAANHLLKMKELFEKEGCPPKALCVVCGLTSYSYTRPDGVSVVPITSLGP